jgi:outer membrane protein TolC
MTASPYLLEPSIRGIFRRAASALVIPAVLAGCVASRHDANDDLRVPAQYGRGEAELNRPSQELSLLATHPASDIAADAWWQNFGDDNLNRMVQAALRANNDLAIAGLRLQQARLQAGLADNELLPQLVQ